MSNATGVCKQVSSVRTPLACSYGASHQHARRVRTVQARGTREYRLMRRLAFARAAEALREILDRTFQSFSQLNSGCPAK